MVGSNGLIQNARFDVGLLFVGDWLPRMGPDYRRLLGGRAAIGNLECAITDRSQSTDMAYSVVLDSSLLTVVRDTGFAALSLANNHSTDAGARVVSEMAQRLKVEAGVAPYGLRSQPLAEVTADGKRCAVVGCLERGYTRSRLLFPEEDVESELRKLHGAYDAVFVTPHWGKEGEYAAYPSPRQRRLARRWIDAGAAGIFGHHPHTVQARESVEGRPVYYSLGNFDFDHEEGREYALTRWGLTVSWHPATPARFNERYLGHDDGQPRWLSDEEAGPVRRYVERISARIVDSEQPWSSWAWARSVGPIYIGKSRRSWARRLARRRRSRTVAKWLVWNCLPTTLLMRAGSWLQDRAPDLPSER